jgi:hypothetical protein
LQVGGNAELRNRLVALLLELDVPTATICDMFCLSGREAWNIGASEPVSMFRYLDCVVAPCVPYPRPGPVI